MSNHLELILIERFSEIARMTDAKSIHLKNERGASQICRDSPRMDGHVINENIAEGGVDPVPLEILLIQTSQDEGVPFDESHIVMVSALPSDRHHVTPYFGHGIAHVAKRIGDDPCSHA